MSERAQLYITFGLAYGTAEEWMENHSLEPHPIVPWASGRGYLTVDYAVDDQALTFTTPARERARQAAYCWLDGQFAFDYDLPPTPANAPLGELARLVLP